MGADANIGLGKFANWFNYVAKSETPGLEGGDNVYSSRFQYDNSRHEFRLGYLEVGHNFNPEVGFVRRRRFPQTEITSTATPTTPTAAASATFEPHFSGQNWCTLGTNAKESGFEHYHVDSPMARRRTPRAGLEP